MQAIKIVVTGAKVTVENAPVITSGMIGLPVKVEWDATWDGLHKTLVYKAGDVIRDQVSVEDTGMVPGELLRIPYKTLQIGAYGASAEGDVVIPTQWAQVGRILEGVDPVADPGTDEDLPVWQQLLNRMDALENKEPEMLWEFAVPSRNSTSHDLSWLDNYCFPFLDGLKQDRPWNDRWVEDGQLPADTTMREKANQLYQLIRDRKTLEIEVEVPGVLHARGRATAIDAVFEGLFMWKISMVCGMLNTIYTNPSQMYVVEVSELGISFGAELGPVADPLGWRVRVYG